jgi:V8-like Glu-specific endopeptidase
MSERNITTEDCDRYLQLFAGPGREFMLEMSGGQNLLSDRDINERIEISEGYIGQLAPDRDKADPALIGLHEQIKRNGKDILQQVRQKDIKTLNNIRNAELLLEAIVMTDGSRPSFLIRNDQPDLNSNPKGAWEGLLTANGALLTDAIACVGRIESTNDPAYYWGTGFLIADNLLMTNLHVLEEIGSLQPNGEWLLDTSVQMNFGREKLGTAEKNIRILESVVFYGEPIPGYGKHDLALISLKPVDAALLPAKLITPALVNSSKNDYIYSVGYPGPPRPGDYKRTIISLLFGDGFGHKRLAPGAVLHPPSIFSPFSFTHDATTLGGNSGSPVLFASSCLNATGLHYAGASLQANFAHALMEVRALSGAGSGKLLNDIFKDYGI